MSRVVFFVAAFMAGLACADTRYFSEFPDLPLPPGFTETNTAAGFDGDHARLAVADAVGSETTVEVRVFYADSLPALGWSVSPTTDGSAVFVRGRERLTLDVAEAAGHTHLHVQLVVSAAPTNGD